MGRRAAVRNNNDSSMKKSKHCYVCNSEEENDLELGEFKSFRNLSVHYFCLLLTSGLAQNGSDDEGILGFMPKDILAEVERIKRLKCSYCKKPQANIGCCMARCRRTFHTRCGIDKGCLMQFDDPYPSFCHQHIALGITDGIVIKSRGAPRKRHHTAKEMCTICYEDMGAYHAVRSVLSPCCKTHWFHQRCLKEFAKNAGYFFKCPMCNDVDTFRNVIKWKGVFVPDRDAAWELEPNAFAELLEVPETCEAIECVCPQGRTYQNTLYSLVRCSTCGSHCMHNKCLPGGKVPFMCADCALPPPVEQPAQPSLLTAAVVEEQVPASSTAPAILSSATISRFLETSRRMKLKLRRVRIPSGDDTRPELLAINQSTASDVEFIETKEDIFVISDDDDDDTENDHSATNSPASIVRRNKRSLDVATDMQESPASRPPCKKMRRALLTMRAQSKITSFFSALNKQGPANSNGAAAATVCPIQTPKKVRTLFELKKEPGTG